MFALTPEQELQKKLITDVIGEDGYSRIEMLINLYSVAIVVIIVIILFLTLG